MLRFRTITPKDNRRCKMKKAMLFCLIGAFVMTSTVVSAQENQEKAPLGVGNLALKVDYIAFTENDLEDADIDSGLYLGIEGYGEIVPNLYLGAEVGWANPDGDVFGIVDTELTYIPVEVNLKYAAELSPQFIIDVGAGVSYNYAKIELDAAIGTFEDIETGEELGASIDESEWLFGGQFFVDLNYTFDQFFLGINGKYQITEEGDDLEVSFDNWRIGGQIGFFF
jgi:hypothetical protein